MPITGTLTIPQDEVIQISPGSGFDLQNDLSNKLNFAGKLDAGKYQIFFNVPEMELSRSMNSVISFRHNSVGPAKIPFEWFHDRPTGSIAAILENFVHCNGWTA